jgi:hypothetical protein
MKDLEGEKMFFLKLGDFIVQRVPDALTLIKFSLVHYCFIKRCNINVSLIGMGYAERLTQLQAALPSAPLFGVQRSGFGVERSAFSVQR